MCYLFFFFLNEHERPEGTSTEFVCFLSYIEITYHVIVDVSYVKNLKQGVFDLKPSSDRFWMVVSPLLVYNATCYSYVGEDLF